MTKWFVFTPFADFIVEAEDGQITSAPRIGSDLCGLTVDKAREVCFARGWGFEAA